MKIPEGRMPLAKLVGEESDKALDRIGRALDDMLQRHDYPEDVVLMVNNYTKAWAAKWKAKGVGKRKDSFQEFNNRGIVGFGGGLTHLGIAQMKAAKRHAINQGKIPKSGES
tara:strand:- start:663 stop:998 length:336 start_codon:yes stop_codon:yes gene_type:complete